MRLFGGDRLKGMMGRLGMEDGEPIEHSWVTSSIERAQTSVEARNFEIRKHLLEYDDVMNKQRETVYGAAQAHPGQGGPPGVPLRDRRGHPRRPARTSTPAERTAPGNGTWRASRPRLALLLRRGRGPARRSISSEASRDELHDAIVKAYTAKYEAKEQRLPPEVMREYERMVMLQVIDNQWKDHLLSMDHLKEGIGPPRLQPARPPRRVQAGGLTSSSRP